MKTVNPFFHLTGPKSLDWSFPTSPNAIAAHYPQGCWTVSIGTENGTQAVSSFAIKSEAIAFAQTLPNKWDYFTPHVYPEVLEIADLVD